MANQQASRKWGIAALAVSCALAGCASDPATRREERGAVTSILAAQARAPLDLDLAGRDLGEGRLELKASVRLERTLAAPPVVRVELPEGAELVSGARQEVLSVPGTGVTAERTWVIRNVHGPVTVTVSSQGATMGASARARWPREVPAPTPAPGTVPIPRTIVGGVPVDEAVPAGR